MKKFRIAFTVKADHLSAVLGTIGDVVDDLEMHELFNGTTVKQVKHVPKKGKTLPVMRDILHFARSNKGIEFMYKDKRITSICEKHGMKPSSAGPILSMLSRNGNLRRIGRGLYTSL